jgi:hypothetical protein
MRGRSRKSQNPLSRVYESNGPDVKIRGSATHVAEKYVQLARDAQASGDPVAAENYYQHAEHYFRLIAAAQEQYRQSQPYYRPETADARSDEGYDDGEDDGMPAMGGEPGYGGNESQPYVPREAQPFPPRDSQAYPHREPQPYPTRDGQQQPHYARQHHPAPPPHNDSPGDVDRLPSFITGGAPQPQGNGQNGYEGAQQHGQPHQPDRHSTHRRRRRHRGPRGDSPSHHQGGDDARQPND